MKVWVLNKAEWFGSESTLGVFTNFYAAEHAARQDAGCPLTSLYVFGQECWARDPKQWPVYVARGFEVQE